MQARTTRYPSFSINDRGTRLEDVAASSPKLTATLRERAENQPLVDL
jgi:hypothetical protein